eukprot:11221127-Heterocapsa_arctica.AAC.1
MGVGDAQEIQIEATFDLYLRGWMRLLWASSSRSRTISSSSRMGSSRVEAQRQPGSMHPRSACACARALLRESGAC